MNYCVRGAAALLPYPHALFYDVPDGIQLYSLPFSEQLADEYQQTCQEHLDIVQEYQPELLQKRKIHLLPLYLVDNTEDVPMQPARTPTVTKMDRKLISILFHFYVVLLLCFGGC